MKKYKILEDIAIADIAIESYGKDLNELFENAAFAVFEESANLSNVEEKIKKNIKIDADNIEDLLFDFLSEILFLKDTYSILFKKTKVKIENKDGKYSLSAELTGEEINREKHELRNDIKAITLHMFKIEKTKDRYKALVVVDV
ncbi:MAG TPA: archease [Candidatus Woesearchaeota archaeon]|jgi:SHS2 domain-containing protein|nr:archease [Candidatus Woesearchaeota archaeon]|tara:strand:- start:132 stop:563 length:432 start_codon:yes stop_codon:yes gene_type:complete